MTIMAHLSRSVIRTQVAWPPFICNHCRLSIARSRDAVAYQRRWLRTRPNHPPRPILDTKVEDLRTAPIIAKSQDPERVTALVEDGHPTAPLSRTTSHTEPEILDQVQIDNEVLDLEDSHENLPGPEAEGYVPAVSWEGLKSFKPSEWDAQAQYKA